jgi:hypothetical protein
MRDYPTKKKYKDNSAAKNRDVVFRNIFEDVMNQQLKKELNLYQLTAKVEGFKIAMQDPLMGNEVGDGYESSGVRGGFADVPSVGKFASGKEGGND